METIAKNKVKFFSSLADTYKRFGDPREMPMQFVVDDLGEMLETPFVGPSQPHDTKVTFQNRNKSVAYALILEVAAEFDVRLYETKEAAETAEAKFRAGHLELISYGEVSTDVVEIAPILDEKLENPDAHHIAHFFVYGTDGDFNLCLHWNRENRDRSLRCFRSRDQSDVDEYIIGTGMVHLPTSMLPHHQLRTSE